MSRFLTDLMSKPKAQEKPSPKSVVPEKPRLELVEDNQPNLHNQPNITNPTKPTAPISDFTKVANSIARSAVPERLFRGMSKNTYDALYLKTRGAINPVRKIRATKSDLLRWCGVSDVTIDKHLKHLKSVGLVKVDFVIGSHEGNWYEVFIPEEIDIPNIPNQPNQDNQPYVPKKVGGLVSNLVGDVGGGQLAANKEDTTNPKTSFKDNTKNDDESASALFSDFIEKFQTAATKLTGAQLSKYEREKWGRLADLLILELETASRHASNPVSSVPAFLTKVLSSKLLNQKPAERTSKSKSGTKPDTVGKYYPEDDEIKPLNDESKEAAVDFLREFKDEAEFLEGYKKWYTEEDWSWILKQLKIKN